MAKTKEDLEKSRKKRSKVLALFGGKMVESIIKHDKSASAIDNICSAKGVKGSNSKKAASTLHNENKNKLFSEGITPNIAKLSSIKISSMSGRGEKNTVLSLFPQNIGRYVLNFYTKEGDIVIDPFAGHNSRMQLCYEAKRHYYGQDLSHEFMDFNREVLEYLKERYPFIENNCKVVLKEGDSKKLKFKSNFADFTITSPPYWDMEYYGDEKEQLGLSKTYDEFLDLMIEVMAENFRCLKSGAYCVWFVNDFRKNKKFYNYHGDTIWCMEEVGFIQHDIIISDLGSSIGQIFAGQFFDNKIIPKRHEYGLVFKKP